MPGSERPIFASPRVPLATLGTAPFGCETSTTKSSFHLLKKQVNVLIVLLIHSFCSCTPHAAHYVRVSAMEVRQNGVMPPTSN